VYCQSFDRFENIEQLFNLNKNEIENRIKREYNYTYSSKNGEIITYVKHINGYSSYVINLIFNNNRLKAISWDNSALAGYYTVKEIGEDSSYIIDESKTDDKLGMVTAISKEKDLQISTFYTSSNKQKGMISFSLYKIGNKKVTIKKKIKEREVVQIKEAPKPKLYNLEEKDVESYNKSVEQQKNTIFDYFKNGTEKLLKSDLEIPTFEEMIKDKKTTYTFDNTYNIYYKTINDIDQQISGFENLSGSDKKSNLFKNKNMIIIPTIKENDNEIMTELSIKNVRFIYKKGYVFAKIKKKQFILEDSPILEKNIENEIKSKMQQQKKGNYLIGYIYINTMGKEDLIVNFEELKKDNSVLNKFLLNSSYSIMRSLL